MTEVGKIVTLMTITYIASGFILLQEISPNIGQFIEDGCGDQGWICKDNSNLEVTELGNIFKYIFCRQSGV